MPQIDGAMVISAITQASADEQQALAARRAAIDRVRAEKRLAAALKPRRGKGHGKAAAAPAEPTREENERFRQLSVELSRRGLLTTDMTELEVAEIERNLWAWMRHDKPMVWGHFVDALKAAAGILPPPAEPSVGARKRPHSYGDGHLHSRAGW